MLLTFAKAMSQPCGTVEPSDAAEAARQRSRARVAISAGWIIAWLPALAALLWVCRYRMPVPFHDDWAFVIEYRRMAETGFSWEEIFRPINGHSLVVPKLIFFGVLEFLRGDLSLLPLFTWGLCLVSSLCVVWLAREWRASLPGRGWPVALLWNLGLFSAAEGNTWFWNCTFHHYLPGCCLVAALASLSVRGRLVWPGVALAFVLGAVAALSFGAGFLVPFLLVPMVARALRAEPRGARVAACVLWTTAAVLLAWVALFAYPLGGAHITPLGERAQSIAEYPGLAVQYVLVLCGLSLGTGTAVEPGLLCAAFGVAVIGALAWASAALARGGKWSRLLPWLTIAAWAAGNIGLITLCRLRYTVHTALAARYMVNTHFLTLAAVAVVAAWMAHSSRWRGWFPVKAAAWLLLFGHLSSWAEGFVAMHAGHARMRQERAAICFTEVLPPLGTGMWWFDEPGDTAATARFLRDHGMLKKTRILPSNRIADFRQGAMLQNHWTSWQLESDESGKLRLQGTCAYDASAGVDLVVISARDPQDGEVVVGLARPEAPDDFARRELNRRASPARFFGWSFDIPPAEAASASPGKFRAYAFDGDTGKINLIPHLAVVPEKKLVRAGDDDKGMPEGAN